MLELYFFIFVCVAVLFFSIAYTNKNHYKSQYRKTFFEYLDLLERRNKPHIYIVSKCFRIELSETYFVEERQVTKKYVKQTFFERISKDDPRIYTKLFSRKVKLNQSYSFKH